MIFIPNLLNKHNNNSVCFFDAAGGLMSKNNYQELEQQAMKMADCLQSQYRLQQGCKIGLIAQTRKEFICLFFACQKITAIPCILPFKLTLGGWDDYAATIKQMIAQAQIEFLVCPERLRSRLQNALPACSIQSYENIANMSGNEHSAGLGIQNDENGDGPAYIQFTSGTTALPKPIAISHQAASANISAILQESIHVTDKDRAFSWLPLYHDMGFLGLMLAPLAAGISIDYIEPSTFARKPGLWLELMSERKSTITYAPEFAYLLAMRRCHSAAVLDLSHLRITGVGADMIHWDSLQKFAAAMAPAGFQISSFKPSYGLAEATLAVALTPDDEAFHCLEVSINGKKEKVVSSGTVLSNFDIAIRPDACAPVVPGYQVGEILLQGPSLALSPELAFNQDHFAATGDIGFLKDTQLFVLGRIKDIIIINGQNFSLPGIEWALKSIGHRHGIRVVAINYPDTDTKLDRLLILIESKCRSAAERLDIGQQIISHIAQSFGIFCLVDWLEPKQLAHTSSGKLARLKIQKDYASHTLTRMAIE